MHPISNGVHYTHALFIHAHIHMQGYYTVDIRCEYEIAFDHLVAPTLYMALSIAGVMLSGLVRGY